MSFDSDTRAIFAEMFSDFCADVATGGVGSVVFQKKDDDGNDETLFTITEFELDTHDSRERRLPPDVALELRIQESLIDVASMDFLSSISHVMDERTIKYRVLEQSFFYPSRFFRLWLFWLAPIGVIPADAETFFVITDNGDFVVTDNGDSVVWDGV